jgi:hypothetical protein
MKLSEKAREDLVKTLQKEIGSESISMLDDTDLDHIGSLLLSIFAESLRLRANSKKKSDLTFM